MASVALPFQPAPPRDGTRLVRSPLRWLVVAVTPMVAAGLGVATALGPVEALAGSCAIALAACVWRWPALAAYLVIGLTPLTVGFSRGTAIPVVRPNEALALFLGATLAARGLVRLRTGQLPGPRLHQLDLALLLMAIADSVVPLMWMVVRQQPVTHDDLLYSLVLWKFLGLYALVRVSVKTDRQVLRCLWLSLAAACVVGLLAILQSRGLLGVSGLLNRFYASGVGAGLTTTRGSSTLGLPAATADFMMFSLAVACGLWARLRGADRGGRPPRSPRSHRLALAGAIAILVMGALAAGEFSSAIGLVVGVIAIAVVLRKPKLVAALVPVAVIAGFVTWPVIARRLSGFQSASGLPVSWTGRLQNLRTYFWPTLFSHGNFVLGVRPSARIAVPTQISGYVWIESGYTWLLWGGGIPLLASFLFFTYAAARRGWVTARAGEGARGLASAAVFAPANRGAEGARGVAGAAVFAPANRAGRGARGLASAAVFAPVNRAGEGARGVAGVAVFAAIFVIACLMVFDPHLTYRGSADDFFFLLALTSAAPGRPVPPGAEQDTPHAEEVRT